METETTISQAIPDTPGQRSVAQALVAYAYYGYETEAQFKARILNQNLEDLRFGMDWVYVVRRKEREPKRIAILDHCLKLLIRQIADQADHLRSQEPQAPGQP